MRDGSYDVRVRAYGNGTTYGAAWGAPAAALTTTTGVCTPPVFDPASYTFSVVREARNWKRRWAPSRRPTSSGEAVTYAISDGNTDDVFAIDETSGAITVAGSAGPGDDARATR